MACEGGATLLAAGMAAFRNERTVHPITPVRSPSNQRTGIFEAWSIRYVHLAITHNSAPPLGGSFGSATLT